MNGDRYFTYNYGPSWWQIVIAVLLTLAVYDLAREQGWDRLVDAWRDWRELRRDDDAALDPPFEPDLSGGPITSQVEDAADLDHGPDRRFVPSVPRTVLSEDGTTETPYEPEAEKELT